MLEHRSSTFSNRACGIAASEVFGEDFFLEKPFLDFRFLEVFFLALEELSSKTL